MYQSAIFVSHETENQMIKEMLSGNNEMIKKSIQAMIAMDGDVPNIFGISLPVLYVPEPTSDDGTPLGMVFTQVMSSKGKRGWLYHNAHAVAYKLGSFIHFVPLSALKVFVEDKFKSKKFSDTPQAGKLQRKDQEVLAWISLKDLSKLTTYKLNLE